MNIIPVAVCGNVDHGKSSLLGALLFSTNELKTDQIEKIKNLSQQYGRDFFDHSLCSDGLQKEQTQSITVDVAHKYIDLCDQRIHLHDCPGHAEYWLKASSALTATSKMIQVIDVELGPTTQTNFWFDQAACLGVKEVIICLNKMDKVGYSEKAFLDCKSRIEADLKNKCFRYEIIPVSARKLDNLTEPSRNMAWWSGSTLLGAITRCLPSETESQSTLVCVQRSNPLGAWSKTEFTIWASLFSGELKRGDVLWSLSEGEGWDLREMRCFGERIDSSGPQLALELDLWGQTPTLTRGTWLFNERKKRGYPNEAQIKLFTQEETSELTKKILSFHRAFEEVSGRIVKIIREDFYHGMPTLPRLVQAIVEFDKPLVLDNQPSWLKTFLVVSGKNREIVGPARIFS